MKILITSIIDLEKTINSRLHQIVKCLLKKHDVTVLSINDIWKRKQIKTDIKNQEINNLIEKITLKKFTEKRINPVTQELLSWQFISDILYDMKYQDFDIHFNYNTLFSGYHVAKKLRANKIKSVYDIADNLPDMIGTSPQLNYLFKIAGKYFGRRMLKKNIQLAEKVTYITSSLRKNSCIPNEKAIWIPNGVDTNIFKKMENSKFRQEVGIDDKFIIGFIGALREWVDFQPVFYALRELKKEFPMISILIIGEEEGLNRIKEQAKFSGVKNKVIFRKAVPYNEVSKNINAMDVCLIPFVKNSVGEDSLPLKLFEYMACEKPVISTNLKGIKEVVNDKILYADNYNDFKKHIIKLYNDKELRKKMGKTSCK